MSISFSRTSIRESQHTKPLSIWATLRAMLAVSRQRRNLADLDDHMLQDIGVTRSEAMQESMKTAWNVPDHWRK